MVQQKKKGAADLDAQAHFGRRNRKQMEQRHEADPEKIGVALYPGPTGVPDQAVTVREVTRIGHRDHVIVE